MAELFTRLESSDTAREERQYASMIGRHFVEPYLVSLLARDSSIREPVSLAFVRAYNNVAWQYRQVMFPSTARSTLELMNRCDDERLLWRECSTSSVPDTLRRRGIKRLPSNKDLATILLEVDRYIPNGDSSFLGAYQSGELAPDVTDIESVNNYNLLFRSRFLLNALLIVAREVIARAPNYADLPVDEINKESIRVLKLDGEDAQLIPNVVLKGSANSQLDAVLLRGNSVKVRVFNEKSIFLPNDRLSWDMVNVKALGAYSSVTNDKSIKKPRREDIYQIYGQLLKLMHAGLSPDGKSLEINYPENLILVYARPFQELSRITVPLDDVFWKKFYDDLDGMLMLGRIGEENAKALIAIYPFFTHKVEVEIAKAREKEEERIKHLVESNQVFKTVYDSKAEWQSSVMPPNFGKKEKKSKSTKS